MPTENILTDTAVANFKEEILKRFSSGFVSGFSLGDASEVRSLLDVSVVATEKNILANDFMIDGSERVALLPPVCGG